MATSRTLGQVGRVVGGRYRLLAPIGTGGSADVFVADDVTLRRRVAVKVLHAALAGDDSFLRRFRAEARTVAALRHPNIMGVYDWGEDGDGPFLVLEYLGGGSLRDLMDRGSRLSLSQALLVGTEAARALDYAHRRGLVHRDVKPANLLFDDEGRLCIADFGIARALAEATWTEPTGAMVGTVRYASPEQARGNSVDGKADVYALALVLIEAVTGVVPFAADTTIATLMGRLDGAIPVPEAMGPLAGPLRAAGAFAAQDRTDAAGLVTALNAAAKELPVPAPLPLSPVVIDLTKAAPDPTEMRPAVLPPSVARGSSAALSGAVFDGVTDSGVTRDLGPSPWAPRSAGNGAQGRPSAGGPWPGSGWRPGSPGDLTGVAAGPGDPTRGKRRWLVGPRRQPDGMAGPGSRAAGPRAGNGLPAPRGRRRRWPTPVGLLAAMALVIALGVGIGNLLVPRFAIPTITPGMLASKAPLPHRFKLKILHTFRDGTVSGAVLGQNPLPKAKARSGATITVTVSNGPTLVAVPDLAGLSKDAAATMLRDVGLNAQVGASVFSDSVNRGSVVDWQPKGRQVVKGSDVALILSKGIQPVSLPDFRGQPYDTVKAALDRLQLPSTKQLAPDDNIPEGSVISTVPGAGDVSPGTTIAVTVSQGPPLVIVPDVTSGSLTLDQATAMLESVGLKANIRHFSVFGTGRIVFENPHGGSKFRRGSSVLLVVDG